LIVPVSLDQKIDESTAEVANAVEIDNCSFHNNLEAQSISSSF
jgi:hypothetical protein